MFLAGGISLHEMTVQKKSNADDSSSFSIVSSRCILHSLTMHTAL